MRRLSLGILAVASLAVVEGCAASRSMSSKALRAAGFGAEQPAEAQADATSDQAHWSEEWVWEGDRR
ncbi:MAG: hypothetical protein AAGH41_01460 [Pseudomonadota bacterium]